MTTISRLDTYFINLINDLMALERQPLERLQEQKDTINVRRGAYVDVKTQLDELQDLVKSLISTDPLTIVKAGRSVSVSNVPEGSTVLTASAASSTLVGSYEIAVGQLAVAQSRASAVQIGSDLDLGLSGTFRLGGNGSASASVTSNSTVGGVGTAAVAEDQRELGTGTYTVETRTENGVLQFRVKDVDGRVVTVKNQIAGGSSFTSGWQELVAGEFDTGRGLTINFSGAAADVSTAIGYTAAGTSIEVETSDTLIDIARKINEASQPQGRDVQATVVGSQLVLTAVNSGTTHTMIYSDGVGLGFSGEDLRAARDATFTVNGIDFTRSSNTALTDVILGITLNLAADAEGRSATLQIEKDLSVVMGKVGEFVEKFNAFQTYLESKTSVTSINSGEALSYVRGTLSGDSVFNDLRMGLFTRFTAITENSGIYSSLRDIGIAIDSGLKATISDPGRLEAALEENFASATALLNEVMGSFDVLLGRFTGTSSGYLDRALKSFDEEIIGLEGDIQDLNLHLLEREGFLTQQYAMVQSQLASLSYMQQMWAGIYGSINQLL
jgi:flagellar hook-associated protein 2